MSRLQRKFFALSRWRVTRWLISTCAAALLAALFVAGSSSASRLERPRPLNAHHSSASAHAAVSCKQIKLGGVMTFGVTQDPIAFDPPYTQDNGSLWADMNIYNQLVELNPDASKLVPGLAKSWRIVNHGRTYIFRLRAARFSNGDPVTAQDVVFSLTRAASPKAFANVGLNIITSVRAQGTHTVSVTTRSVSGAFLSDLALWPASIIDVAAFRKEGEASFKDRPIGSGPFYVAAFKPGSEVVFKRNPYYWGTDACGHHYPYLNTVVLRYMPNDNARVTALQSGAVDAILQVPYNEVAGLSSGAVTATTTPELATDLFALSQKVPAFRNTDVIQAINYAIDRRAIVRAVLFGHGSVADSPMQPGIDFYTGAYGYQYNLAKAKKLMKASGFKSFSATLTVPAGDSVAAGIAQILQNELKSIGGTIAVQQEDVTTLQDQQSAGKLEMTWTALTSDVLDPSENSLFCCVSNGGADANYTGWKDPQADALYNAAQATLNETARSADYREWQKVIMRRAPLIWVVDPPNAFAYRNAIHGFTMPKTGHYTLWVVWKG